uniref:Uncharacterized protein n=1 Tax=Tetranychus urticae TaxID=32264 RepID=T1JWE9_TETUR
MFLNVQLLKNFDEKALKNIFKLFFWFNDEEPFVTSDSPGQYLKQCYEVNVKNFKEKWKARISSSPKQAEERFNQDADENRFLQSWKIYEFLIIAALMIARISQKRQAIIILEVLVAAVMNVPFLQKQKAVKKKWYQGARTKNFECKNLETFEMLYVYLPGKTCAKRHHSADNVHDKLFTEPIEKNAFLELWEYGRILYEK